MSMRKSESNRERIAFGPLCITVLFLALKRMVFLKKKILPKKNKFFFTFFLCNFSVRTLWCFQKNFKNFFLTPKKWKNRPKKLLIIGPDPFLRQSSPGHSPQPRSSFPFYKRPNPNVSLLVSGFSTKWSYTRISSSQKFCLLHYYSDLFSTYCVVLEMVLGSSMQNVNSCKVCTYIT